MARADALARRHIDECRFTEPPIDPSRVAELLGITLAPAPMSPDITGVFLREPDRVVVGVNANLTPHAHRFALAHGIGHACFSRGGRRIVDTPQRLSMTVVPELATDREEIEANRFATALLLPEHLVGGFVKDAACPDAAGAIAEVARAFDVGELLAGGRLLGLGIIPGVD